MDKKEMTAKEYLQQIRADGLRIEQKIKEYESLSSRKASLVGMNYTAERVQTSPDGGGFTKIVDRLVDLQQEINDDIDEAKRSILSIVQSLKCKQTNAKTQKILKEWIE